MQNNVRAAFFLLLSFGSFLRAEIVTHVSLAALAEYIAQEPYDRNDIFVVCDLDNTLIHPKTEVGSDQWLEHEARQLAALQGMSVGQAFQEMLPLYYKIQHAIDLHLTEALIPELIATLKNDGVVVCGLTARHDPIIDRTLSQLATLGIEFSLHAEDEVAIEAALLLALYKKGIIFCGNNNKGEVLFKFFKMLGIKPKKIFFVDDKKHHLASVEKMALEHDIDCVCIHYTGCLERVENFNPEQARQEMREILGQS